MSGAMMAIGLVAIVLIAIGALVAFAANTARRVERALPPEGTFVEVDGARLHYVERGSGAITLLMVHGLAGNGRHFTHSLVDRLAAEYRVIVVDRPGSGYSTRRADAAAGPRAQAETIAAFIRTLGLERPVLVGHSLGGAVALATALAHPTLVRALALVAPLTQVQDTPPDVFKGLLVRNPVARRAIAWTLAIPLSIARRDVVLDTVFGPDAVPRDFALAGGGLLGMRPGAYVSASTDLVAVAPEMRRMVADYGRLDVPVGIIYGTDDRILDATRHGRDFLTLVPGAYLELIEGAGHMIPLTAPDRVAAFIRTIAETTTGASPMAEQIAASS